MQSIALIVASVGLVVFLAHLFTGIFERTRIPDVILLLAIGVILGPITGLVLPSKLGNLGNVFATITLVIILFEGGTTLKVNNPTASCGALGEREPPHKSTDEAAFIPPAS